MPAVVGKVRDHVPAAAAGWTVTVPEVFPVSERVPLVVPATPKVGVAVKAGEAPPKTCPAAPVRLRFGVAPPLDARGAEPVTEVTVPLLPEAHVVTPEPLVCKNWFALPAVVGKVNDHVPAVEAG